MTEYTYSFHCPSCGGSWTYEQFTSITKNVFSSWNGKDACPLCRRIFQWVRPGELENKPWWDNNDLMNYSHPCEYCGATIESKRRRFCNKRCANAWYYKNVTKLKIQRDGTLKNAIPGTPNN